MKKIIIGIIAIILIVAGFSYFGKNSNQQAVKEPIKIGFIAPLTGDAVSYGEPIKNSATIAVDEINNKGGIDGRKLEVIYEDSKCSGKDAVSATQKLINTDGVKIIAGIVCSGDLLSIAPVTEQNKIIVFSPAASSPDITNAGDFIFRNNPSDSDSGRATAEIMLKNHRKVAVISENTDYAQGALKVFVKFIKQGGGELVANENFAPGTTDFRTHLTKIKAANPEALFINPQVERAGGAIVKQAREIGIGIPLFGNVVVAGAEALKVAGTVANGLTVIDAPGLSKDNPKAVKFLADYQAKYGKPNLEFYMGASYDHIYILTQAIKEVGLDTEKIRDYLYGLQNFSGVIGNYGLDKNGDLTGITFTVKQIVNGEVIEVK